MDKRTESNNIILEFAYETGDASCRYWQEWVIVNDENGFDKLALEDSIASYMDSAYSDDKDYGEMTADIMNASGLSWEFVGQTFPESRTVCTFWI